MRSKDSQHLRNTRYFKTTGGSVEAGGGHLMIPLVSDALGNDLNTYTRVVRRKQESHVPEFNSWPGSEKKHSQAPDGVLCG